ncbi:polymer-forming cytoskeletal protein [Paracoccaceae bacterium]|nr:polymer-forming cytoskeletal protein [Paracoccaceae bacterium]
MIFSSWKKRKIGSDKTKLVAKNTIKKENNLNFNGIKLDGDSPPSLLGKEIKIIGEVTSRGAVQLDGVLEGEITASKLVIEKSAKVIGSVTSEDLVIKGRIIGPVFGKKVRFGSSARVEGDTFHETIAIEDGAYYEGSIKRHSSNAHISKELVKNTLIEKS